MNLTQTVAMSKLYADGKNCFSFFLWFSCFEIVLDRVYFWEVSEVKNVPYCEVYTVGACTVHPSPVQPPEKLKVLSYYVLQTDWT